MSTVCLSAFYDMLCQHTQHYDEKLLSPNMDPLQSMQLKQVGNQSQQFRGNKLFRNMHIFSKGIFLLKGTAKLLPSIPFTSCIVMKSSTNPSVRFQVGLSQVLSRCSDYWDGYNPGIVESGTDLTAMHAGMSMEDVWKFNLTFKLCISLNRCFKALMKHLNMYD